MEISTEVRATVRKYAIKNAVDYGRASDGAVLNKAISAHPEVKSDIKSLALVVKDVVKEINGLGKTDLESQYSKYAKEFEDTAEQKAKEAKPKFVLEGATEGDLVVRASPEPSGYAHIGHAKQAFLNDEFARIYKGKIYLYFDDTNPEKARQEYVDAIRRDLGWLGIKFAKEYYASDNIEKIYDYARQLLKEGKAYVCECNREEMSQKRFKGEECKHKSQPAQKNAELFEQMVAGKIEEGQMIVRLNGDMKSQNTALRDPALLRVVNTPHYRAGTKYHVWPIYDFNTPILDSLNGITDIIRSKEYELRDALVAEVLNSLGLRVPRMHLEARLNIDGNTTHKRVLRQLIADGLIKSWDDPRLMTLMALRRRGIRPEAIREFVLRFGMSKTDSTVSLDILLAENKKIIDLISKHLFFVGDPVKLTVKGAQEQKVSLKLHPSGDHGTRDYTVKETFYISKDDAEAIKQGDVIRLKDLMDIKITSAAKSGITAEVAENIPKGRIIQWVSEGNYSECSIIIPGDIMDKEGKFIADSLKTANGYIESYATKLAEHETVQLERFGYATLDSKKGMQLIFLSK